VLGLAVAPAKATSIYVSEVLDPGGNQITLVNSGTGLYASGSYNDISWTSLRVVPTANGFGLSGQFSCSDSCYFTFEVDFSGSGYNPGTTAHVSELGTATTFANTTWSAFVSNTSIGSTSTNGSGSFNTGQSSPIVVPYSGGNFSGEAFFDISMGSPGNLTLYAGSTADLVFRNGSSSVPEPGSLAIGGACIGLLFYIKRRRKA
jgi:hypothetical protein